MKIGSGVQAVGDGEIKKGKGKKGKGRKGKDTKKRTKCYNSHPCSEGPSDAIFTKFGTVVDLTYVMTYAHFGWNRLKVGHFAAVQILPIPYDFNGWPYNRQALTCCRDCDADWDGGDA